MCFFSTLLNAFLLFFYKYPTIIAKGFCSFATIALSLQTKTQMTYPADIPSVPAYIYVCVKFVFFYPCRFSSKRSYFILYHFFKFFGECRMSFGRKMKRVNFGRINVFCGIEKNASFFIRNFPVIFLKLF